MHHMARQILTTADVRSLFNVEFGPVASQFVIFELDVEEARKSNDTYVYNPGVYVWLHPSKGVIRVGVSMINSRKRSLEHIDANTGGIIQDLSKDSSTK